jgi:hypothetical protein
MYGCVCRRVTPCVLIYFHIPVYMHVHIQFLRNFTIYFDVRNRIGVPLLWLHQQNRIQFLALPGGKNKYYVFNLLVERPWHFLRIDLY